MSHTVWYVWFAATALVVVIVTVVTMVTVRVTFHPGEGEYTGGETREM